MAQSCDVYFYEIAKRTGIERIAAMAKRFGLGAKLEVDLPGEKAGLIPTPKWKRGALDAPWHKGETLIVGIGQGYLLVTPLQLAVMTARIANGGFAVVPRLTRSVSQDGVWTENIEASFESLNLQPRHMEIIRNSMIYVVNSPLGTAYKSRITEPGQEMAGKTGTVQVRRISKSEREAGVRKNKDLPWKERDHALFVGYAPIENPRYAISVVVEHGGGGSKVAAPIARDILVEAQRRDSASSVIRTAMPRSAGQEKSSLEG